MGRPFRIGNKKLRAAPPGGDVIKPCYLENHTSQIKSYNGTLLGSHDHSFRIRQENVRAAPNRGGLTMTSYPVGNKTSLSRKPYIADKKL